MPLRGPNPLRASCMTSGAAIIVNVALYHTQIATHCMAEGLNSSIQCLVRVWQVRVSELSSRLWKPDNVSPVSAIL